MTRIYRLVLLTDVSDYRANGWKGETTRPHVRLGGWDSIWMWKIERRAK